MRLIRLMAVTLCALTASGAAVAPATASASAKGPTSPIYDYTSAVRERIWVQTPVDSDADGKPDRVAVRIIRPATSKRVPVIFQASPYYAGLNDVPNHDDVDRGGAALTGTPKSNRAAATVTFGGYLDNYFVPRGYAVAFADSLGTGGSDGCPTSGGRNETLGMKAVVDWLNGRAPGFDEAGQPVSAGWSTGRTGMIGVSYNGTLPNAVAATGVRGLETIVPIAAISSWYDYYRANGGVVAPGGFQGEDTDILAEAVLTRAHPEACAAVMAQLEKEQDRESGDYNAYWAERDYLRDAGKVRASVFVVHGLHDDNVRTQQFGQWWNALHGPKKIWLHQAAHADPFNVRRDVWLDTLHRWFDQWLYRIDTGIMRDPVADVEVAPNQWRTSSAWPLRAARAVTQQLGSGPRQSFVDDPARTPESLVANETATDPNRLIYLGPALARETRLSGTATVTLRADVTGDSPFLTAMLVDYGTADRWAGTRTLPDQQDCIGPGIPEDPGCFAHREHIVASTPYEIVTRGWLDVRNRLSPAVTRPIKAGQPYTFRWSLQPEDHVFAPGHRIGLVIISTDRDHTLRYPAGTVVNVDPAHSKLVLPLT
ncbi:Xaa-Pro dipeptidyl-peptidase [Paractinoplanes durhamensis]|uniref:Xaa-Pro dipeptidyl-peptidase n=1 Tax=Paractinoplanes durhamensis TaxID=113563 RepID=A0ABQ3ZBD8_9ACTN|nr:Xaa-Pro dipeptidyl-peptidase [Actinoplanes durhamensis]GIE07137.1 Xaa-Pro dipeptidyl-peptidase [Actinoplanes durhamensis]